MNSLSYKPSPKPHFTVLHRIFAQSGPATFADVVAAYGFDFIRVRIAKAIAGKILYPKNHPPVVCIEPQTPAQARLGVWRHLRGVINEQRAQRGRMAERRANYTGDVNSPSPLNPYAKREPVDLELSFGHHRKSDRNYNPLIL